MKKIARIGAFVLALLCVMSLSLPLFAAAYQTYTYDIDGDSMASPDAYTPEKVMKSAQMGVPTELNDVKDLVVDCDNNVYIVDAGNNNVVVLDEFLKYKFSISSFLNSEGVPDSLSSPSGCFVLDKNDGTRKIYVADTGKNRIVIFDGEGEFIAVLNEPESEVFPEGSIYKPIALAVDQSERIYVVSSTTYMGIIVLDEEGVFQSFIGAQAVTASAIDLLWRQFQTAEQRAQSVQYISTEYNNITIDDEGFIYVTTSSIDESSQQSAITSKSGTYSPVKKLNPAGDDVMQRNGFFGTCGEVKVNFAFAANSDSGKSGVSKIIDVALGPENTWSIIDENRSRVYTYDDQGNLLFAFGETGMQLGNIQSIKAIVYQGEKMLILDKTDKSVTIYNRTEYGDILMEALHSNNERQYDQAVDGWKAILQRNSNFDSAYVGIGKALYRAGEWEEAMEYFKAAYDTTSYSLAYKMWRQDWVSKYVIVVPIVVVVVCFLVSKFLSFAGKVNKRTALLTTKRTYGQELIYAFHLIVHPFDGFWDLKHEKRGSVRGALTYIALTVLAFTYNAVGKSYLYNPRKSFASAFMQVVAIAVPIMLWVTANWCLTTLFDGEGSFKDVFVAVGYSVVPLPIFMVISTLLTHICTLDESTFVSMLITIAWVWTGLLIFFGMMVTHDYSIGKNILTCLGTIVGMAFVMFVMMLFSTLVAKMVGFISSIVTEITYRV